MCFKLYYPSRNGKPIAGDYFLLVIYFICQRDQRFLLLGAISLVTLPTIYHQLWHVEPVESLVAGLLLSLRWYTCRIPYN